MFMPQQENIATLNTDRKGGEIKLEDGKRQTTVRRLENY
jgi:hypothetical protein